ncbi:MAG: hypothetical protein V4505_06835 [Pseudomonadota bacterium]
MKFIRIAAVAVAGIGALLLSGCVVAPAPYGYGYGGGYYQSPVVVSPSIGIYGGYGRGYYGGRGRYWR